MDPIYFHSIFFPTMEVNGVHQPSSKYLLLCSAEERNWTYLEKLEGEEISIFG